jgi:hypothetical protein
MFNWFWNRQRKAQEFPDNESAFEHACAVGYTPLIGALIPALVLEEGERGRDGEHTFLIRLAGQQSESTFWSCTLKETLAYPKEGEFVGFRIVMIADDLPEPVNLIGFIACRLERVFVEGKGWVVAQSYTPKNIKQAIRL